MTVNIPCKAVDKSKCRYHGAVSRVEAALAARDMDAYLVAQADVAKAAKSSAEVKAFFSNHPSAAEPSVPVDNHGVAVPSASVAGVTSILRSVYRGHRIPEREPAAERIVSILQEEGSGRYPNHDKYDACSMVLEEAYPGVSDGVRRRHQALERVFLSDGKLVSRTPQGLEIIDERFAQEWQVEGSGLKVNDIIMIDKHRFRILEDKGTDEDGSFARSVTVYGGLVDRQPYLQRAFSYEVDARNVYRVFK